ncbi:MAG: pectinesterase family protein, partial [Gemmatimonadaceae bacterium]
MKSRLISRVVTSARARTALVVGSAICALPAVMSGMPVTHVPATSHAPWSTTVLATTDTLPWAAIVDAKYAGVSGAPGTGGVPTFRSIGDALSSTSVNGGVRTVVFIKNGRYREKLTIDRPRITLRGESRDGAIITFDAVSDTPAPGGGTYGTRGSYTLRIVAPDFRAEHLTIENAYDYAANAAKSDSNPTKYKNPQG